MISADRQSFDSKANSKASYEEAWLRLAAIVESSDDAIISKTLEGIITSWNSGAERIYGYSASEVIGKPISILVPEERIDEVPKILERLKRGERVDHFETERIAKDGRRLSISLTISPIRDGSGQLMGASTIARDITEAKQAQALIQASRRQTELVLQAIPASITVQDPDGRLIFANEAAAKAFGYEAVADLLAQPVSDLLEAYDLLDESGRDFDRDQLPGRLALREGKSSSITICYRNRKTGEERWSNVRATPITNGLGQVEYAVNVFQDITESRRAEEHQRFLSDASKILSSSLDYQTTLTSVAEMAVPRIADWCGVDIVEDETLKRLAIAHVDPKKLARVQLFEELYPPDTNQPFGVPQVLRSGRSEIYPRITDAMPVNSARDEQRLSLLRELGFTSAMIVPLVGDGRILGTLSFIAAESQRHFGPSDLALAEDLGRRAAQAIDHSRLYRLAREANRLKDEFLATVSHELRTPLTAISGYAHMLRTGKLDPAEADHALQVIERSVHAQAQLINDILDVSRVITGKLQLNIQNITPALAINAAIDSIRPEAERKGVLLETEIDPATGPVMGDPNRLQQIAWNLVSNAIKFTPTGGNVKAKLERLDGYIQLQVQDTGIGIRSEFLAHVFERFRQADSSITRKYSGLGLGLAIARHLVELHGGTIEASSEGPGLGATFTVRIPQSHSSIASTASVQTASDEETVTSEQRKTKSKPELDGLKILVVDDNKETCQLLETLFLQNRAQVKTAYSSSDAIAIFEHWEPQILLCDIGMPDEDGYSVMTRIRQAEGTKSEVAAIALTGYARPEDREHALAAGFQLHIPKPIDPESLLWAVAQLTQRNSEQTT